MNALHRFTASRWGIITAGGILGVLAVLLTKLGNPPNMGLCIACFERDIAGALGLHRAAVVQYLRPEIPAILLGSTLTALAFGEFRARGGSAPIVRFALGMFAMIGALVFLGCPWRGLIRLAGGDWNAAVALLGMATGVGVGVLFMRSGYSLGRSRRADSTVVGWVMPALMVGLLLLAVFQPVFAAGGPIFASASGPGSLHAPIVVSIIGGLVLGAIAQRTRFCTMGAIRDVIMIGDTHLFSGIAAFTIAVFILNLALGLFHPGFSPQPVAHSNHVWNFLGMALAGLAFAMAGGCPARQLILAGEGDGDAGVFAIGMIVGAGFAHNFALAGVADSFDAASGALVVGGPSLYGQVAVVLGLALLGALGWALRDKAPVGG